MRSDLDSLSISSKSQQHNNQHEDALTEQEIETLLAMRKKSRRKQQLESVTSAADASTIKKQKELIERLEKSIRVQKAGFQHEIQGSINLASIFYWSYPS